MTQTRNRLLDEVARLMTDAAGAARGVREEIETVMRSQAEKVLHDLDVVQREEFEAIREIAVAAREKTRSSQPASTSWGRSSPQSLPASLPHGGNPQPIQDHKA